RPRGSAGNGAPGEAVHHGIGPGRGGAAAAAQAGGGAGDRSHHAGAGRGDHGGHLRGPASQAGLGRASMKIGRWMAAPLALALSISGATANTAKISGKVKDQDGKPVEGAVVVVQNATMENLVYRQTTGKDGGYQMPSVPYNEQAKTWRISVEKEGYVATHIRMESRNSARTLVGEIVDQNLAPSAGAHELRFVAFGMVKVDYDLGPK